MPGQGLISVKSELNKNNLNKKGILKVEITVDDLINQLHDSDLLQSDRVLLVDREGKILADTRKTTDTGKESGGFGKTNVLEKNTLNGMQSSDSGTIFGKGNPPKQVAGFYKLTGLPLYVVVIAPGKKILQPILKFSFLYLLSFSLCILIIIVFIRSSTGQITDSIKQVAGAAENLADGNFDKALEISSYDEIGDLKRSFNKMTSQLMQRLELQKAMDVAREVQQTFLPRSQYNDEFTSILGSSQYCNETGGDFYDIIHFEQEPNKIGLILGDVVGHGIGAALLMTSIRAMIRTRSELPGTLEEIVTDVNHVLCHDTEESSDFVTLFYAVLDKQERAITWVRAGHDPAMMFYPQSNTFEELKGVGVAMGIDSSFQFTSYKTPITAEKQLLVIGSDGAWEACNSEGEMFGKERIKDIIWAYCDAPPDVITEKIYTAISHYMDGTPIQDDITFMIIRLSG